MKKTPRPSKQQTGKKANKDGHFYEKAALFYMRLKGYHPIASNFSVKRGTGLGEVDLIMCRKKTLVFVEVKKRDSKDNLPFAVTDAMKERITKTAAFYLAQHPQYALFDVRFDVILIKPPFFLRHIQNAWRERWF